jgi:hypothetical protein
MSKLNEIYNGWKNYTFPSPEVEETAKKRITICVECPKLTKTNTCALCGCFMPAKVRSLKSVCYLGKW